MPKKKYTTRKDGRIQAKIYLGTDDNGKQDFKFVYGKTQKEVDEKILQLKISKGIGVDIRLEYDTFGKWAAKFLNLKPMEVSATRLVVYQCYVKHLNRYLEHKQISKIKQSDLQEIVTALASHNPNTGKPMSKATLAGLKSTALQIFELAIGDGVMLINPARKIKLPNTQQETPRRALTDEEQQWIINTPHRARCAAMLMMFAGLRRGETIPLMWSDIDLTARTISVNKTIEKVNGAFKLKVGAKSDSSVRVIDIPQELVDFLRAEPREGLYVCLSAKNKMHSPSSWKRMWESYLNELNFRYGEFNEFNKRPKSKFDPTGVPFVIPHITPHWLRHTFCTMMYLAGVDILIAKDQMGHADIKTTFEIYECVK